MLTDAMHKSNLMNKSLHYMLETPKALSTHQLDSDNLKDVTMDNQQETKVLYFTFLIFVYTCVLLWIIATLINLSLACPTIFK